MLCDDDGFDVISNSLCDTWGSSRSFGDSVSRSSSSSISSSVSISISISISVSISISTMRRNRWIYELTKWCGSIGQSGSEIDKKKKNVGSEDA